MRKNNTAGVLEQGHDRRSVQLHPTLKTAYLMQLLLGVRYIRHSAGIVRMKLPTAFQRLGVGGSAKMNSLVRRDSDTHYSRVE